MEDSLAVIAERLIRLRTELEQHISATTEQQHETAALLDRVQQLGERLGSQEKSDSPK